MKGPDVSYHLVTSIDVNPDADSLLMNSIFVEAGTIVFSFCNPSRGPTSTILIDVLRIDVY